MALITELDDRTLVERHHAGDGDAFPRIVDRYGRSLYAHALRRLGDPLQAEDAVQEALLRAFRNLDGFSGDYKLDAWLHRILTNVCHDIGRTQGRDHALVDRVAHEAHDATPAVDDDLVGVDRTEVVHALDSLPDRYREAVVLRFVDELSYTDVADRTGVTEENARARVSRGRTMLRQKLSSVAGGFSAVFAWAVPSLRRSQPALTGSEVDAVAGVAPVATQSAVQSAVHASPLVAQAQSIVVQAAPLVAQSAPGASTAVKAVVAVGVAASVAIPAGVVVEQKMHPAPEATVVNEVPPVVAPDEPVQVVTPQATEGAAVILEPMGDDTETDVTSDSSVDAESPEDGADGDTTDPDDPVAGDATVEPVAGTGSEPVAEEPAPEAPAPSGAFATSSLTVTEAGPRLELSGAFSLTVGDVVETGTLSGKLLIGDAGADPAAPRSLEGTVTFAFADGSTAEMRVRGTVMVTTERNSTTYAIDARFLLPGGGAHGLAESGELSGTLAHDRSGEGSMALDVPLAPEPS